MEIADSVALVTGGNRGLGAAFCRALVERGAKKVYAGARDPGSVTSGGVEPVRLDVTSPDEVAAAAAACRDVTLLVNNAGISTFTAALAEDSIEQGRREFETNVFGPLAMSRVFAPVLAENGGGAIINVLSVLSWFTLPGATLYSASKSAVWSLTNSLRLELQDQHTQVLAVHAAFIDTAMTEGIDVPKSSPDDVVAQALAALEAGAHEVLTDDISRNVRAGLSSGLPALYPSLT